MIGNKVWILGGPGSGKSTLSCQIALECGYKKVQLDALAWEHHWQKASDERIYERTLEETSGGRWVVDGKYDAVSNLLLERCDTIIFLDPHFLMMFVRVLRRTFLNVLMGKELWNGNRETLSRLLSRHSMPIYLSKIYQSDRRNNFELLERAAKIGIPVVEHIRTKPQWKMLFHNIKEQGGI